MKQSKRCIKIWIDEEDIVNWDITHMKPSEIMMCGNVLIQEGLGMMGRTTRPKCSKQTKNQSSGKR